MKLIAKFLVILCLIFSPLQPLFPIASKISNNSNKNIEVTQEPETETQESTEEINGGMIASNFVTVQIDGCFCSIDIPLSHFIQAGSSTNTFKQFNYTNDSNSILAISYMNELNSNTDFDLYVKNEAHVETEYPSITEVHNGVTWHKIVTTPTQEQNSSENSTQTQLQDNTQQVESSTQQENSETQNQNNIQENTQNEQNDSQAQQNEQSNLDTIINQNEQSNIEQQSFVKNRTSLKNTGYTNGDLKCIQTSSDVNNTNETNSDSLQLGTYEGSSTTNQLGPNVGSSANVYVYYAISSDNTAVFWIKVTVSKEADNEEFSEVISEILDTYKELDEVSALNKPGTVNTVGGTESIEEDNTESTEVASEVNIKEKENPAFKYRGGYVIGADISDDWQDMQVILDGHKIKLPSTLSKLKKAGFEINDNTITNKSDLDVWPNSTLKVHLKNKGGIVVAATFYNDNRSKKKQASKCSIIELEIDSSDFSNIKATDPNDVYNEDCALSEMAANNAKDAYNHEMILAQGVTWGIYLEDLYSCYGSGMTSQYDATTKEILWKKDDNKMIIRTNIVKDIVYVRLSCKTISD